MTTVKSHPHLLDLRSRRREWTSCEVAALGPFAVYQYSRYEASVYGNVHPILYDELKVHYPNADELIGKWKKDFVEAWRMA
jgi:hypothetical protein